MDSDHQAHLGRVIEYITTRIRKKYPQGQKEHGGKLWEKSGIFEMLKEEVDDLVTYAETHSEQLENLCPDCYLMIHGRPKNGKV